MDGCRNCDTFKINFIGVILFEILGKVKADVVYLSPGMFMAGIATAHFGAVAANRHGAPATPVAAASINKQPITSRALFYLLCFFRGQ